MGLYKRKDSPFWWMCFRPGQGSRIYESTGTGNKKLAERIHAQRTLDIAEGRFLNSSSRTRDGSTKFSELATRYIAWAERQAGIRQKRGFVKRLLGEYAGLELKRFSTQLVESYQSGLIAAGKKPATANRHVQTLKHMFTKANEWELVGDDALKRVRRVKLLPERNRRLRYLSTEESTALVNVCDAHLMPIVITALNTGMRKEEILGLEWERVDMRHGFLSLTRTKNGERREVPINATLRAALSAIVRRIGCPFVFTDTQGRRYLDVKRSFTSALKRAGIRDFRFHDLRHTFASQLVMKGVDLTTVKELLGHKSFSMTLRYSHLSPGHMAKAVAVLDSGYDLVTVSERGLKLAPQTP